MSVFVLGLLLCGNFNLSGHFPSTKTNKKKKLIALRLAELNNLRITMCCKAIIQKELRMRPVCV